MIWPQPTSPALFPMIHRHVSCTPANSLLNMLHAFLTCCFDCYLLFPPLASLQVQMLLILQHHIQTSFSSLRSDLNLLCASEALHTGFLPRSGLYSSLSRRRDDKRTSNFLVIFLESSLLCKFVIRL